MVKLLSLVSPMRDYEEEKSVADLATACMNELQFSVSLILILNHLNPKAFGDMKPPTCSKTVNPQWFSPAVAHSASPEFPLTQMAE